MSKLKLVLGGDKLMAGIATFKAKYDETNDMLQQYGISAIHHAAATGDTRPMTAFHNILTVTHQGMFRNFLRILNMQWSEKTACIGFREKKFYMIENTAEQRKLLAELAKDVLLNPPADYKAPDGTSVRRWIDRNAAADQVRLFTDEDLLNGIEGYIKKAEGKQKGFKSAVTPMVLKRATDFRDFLLHQKEQRETVGDTSQKSRWKAGNDKAEPEEEKDKAA